MQILNRFNRSIIFNYEKETLEDANLEGANLEGANLEGANLRGAKYIKSFQCGKYNRVSYAIKWKMK